MRREGVVAWLVALLALLAPTLLAYLGSLSRLFSDDYCHMAIAEQHGVLGGLRVIRDSWNGSITNYFAQFLFASNGDLAPAVYAPLIVAIWLVGLVWLALIALKTLQVDDNRLPLAITVSGLLVAAAINRIPFRPIILLDGGQRRLCIAGGAADADPGHGHSVGRHAQAAD